MYTGRCILIHQWMRMSRARQTPPPHIPSNVGRGARVKNCLLGYYSPCRVEDEHGISLRGNLIRKINELSKQQLARACPVWDLLCPIGSLNAPAVS
eukprot:8079996-Lingulodinium_polyedra.AAC.1